MATQVETPLCVFSLLDSSGINQTVEKVVQGRAQVQTVHGQPLRQSFSAYAGLWQGSNKTADQVPVEGLPKL